MNLCTHRELARNVHLLQLRTLTTTVKLLKPICFGNKDMSSVNVIHAADLLPPGTVGISAFHTTPPPYFTKPFPAPKLPISHYFSHFATTNFLALRNSNMHNSALHSPSQTCYYFLLLSLQLSAIFYTNKPTKWAVGKFISLALARSTRN